MNKLSTVVFLLTLACSSCGGSVVPAAEPQDGGAGAKPDAPWGPEAKAETATEAQPESSPPACPGGMTACKGKCVDLDTDPQNCGSCGVACSPAADCVNATCTCSGCALSPLSPYQKGWVGGDYEIGEVQIDSLGEGTYTLRATPVEPGSSNFKTVDLIGGGSVIAKAEYMWVTTVTQSIGVTLQFEDLLSIEVHKAGGGSMNLYSLDEMFDGKTPLVVDCSCQ